LDKRLCSLFCLFTCHKVVLRDNICHKRKPMNIIELKDRQDVISHHEFKKAYTQMSVLLQELKKKSLPDDIVSQINPYVEEINSSLLTGADWNNMVKKQQTSILKLVEKQLKIVPKGYYTKLWMLLGMSAFGLPFGVVFGLSLGNMGMLAVGLPIGMGIGTAMGVAMDKQALAEGRQLDLEIK